MVKPLLLPGVNAVKVNGLSDSTVEWTLKRHRTSNDTKKTDYMDSIYLIPASNFSEKIFFISDHALSSRRC